MRYARHDVTLEAPTSVHATLIRSVTCHWRFCGRTKGGVAAYPVIKRANGACTALSDGKTASAADRSSARVWAFGTATHCMPAAFAACTPEGASSKTRQP